MTLTDTARNYCAAYGDSGLYTVSYGVEKLWHLGAFEFLHQMNEAVEVIKEGANPKRQKYLTKYFKIKPPQVSDDGDDEHNHFHPDRPQFLPKFVHYAAHAETLSLFFEGLGFHKVDRVAPAAAFFIEFFRKDKEHYVRIYFKNDVDHEEVIKFGLLS